MVKGEVEIMSMMISLDDAVREIDRKKADAKAQYEKHKSEDDGALRSGTMIRLTTYDEALSCLYRVADRTERDEIALRKMQQSALDHFGARAQLIKTIEEMDELREDINESLWYASRCGVQLDPHSSMEKRNRLIEEIADVYNMLDQIVILFSVYCDVEQMKLRKMARTMERYDMPVLWKEGQE